MRSHYFVFFIYQHSNPFPDQHSHEIMESNDIIAPFVLKTYQMVNDPNLDSFIRWGIHNNTFIVLQPLDFSQRLLPANFKHNNFSSFVRQLNTYGFKKVDPDRWEFANEWFLRGQTHLLKNIGRKKQINNRNFIMRGEEDDEDQIVTEIARLKQEQKVLEQELVGMNKRLDATERRPEQMMALLHKVADDPEILPRMMLEINQRSKRLLDKKRQRILPQSLTSPSPSPSGSMKLKEEEECQIIGGWAASSPEGCYGNELFWQSSSPATRDKPAISRQRITAASGGDGVNTGSESLKGIRRYVYYTDGSGGGCDIGYSVGFSPEPDVRPPTDYPFSLFDGGF